MRKIIKLFHRHTWTEWQPAHHNSHIWSHTKEIYKYCRKCGEREYKLLEIFCPNLKRKGEYCHNCLPYVLEIEKRRQSLTFELSRGIINDMQKTKLEYEYLPKVERNRKICELYHEQGKTLSEISKMFNITRERVRQIKDNYEKWLESAVVERA